MRTVCMREVLQSVAEPYLSALCEFNINHWSSQRIMYKAKLARVQEATCRANSFCKLYVTGPSGAYRCMSHSHNTSVACDHSGSIDSHD